MYTNTTYAIKKKRPYSSNSYLDHRAVFDLEELFNFLIPLGNPSLNLSDDDLFYFRLYALAFSLLQFSCCVLIFILNYWHYFHSWYYSEKKNVVTIKKTASVVNFLHENEFRKQNLVYLEEFIKNRDANSKEPFINESKPKLIASNENMDLIYVQLRNSSNRLHNSSDTRNSFESTFMSSSLNLKDDSEFYSKNVKSALSSSYLSNFELD